MIRTRCVIPKFGCVCSGHGRLRRVWPAFPLVAAASLIACLCGGCGDDGGDATSPAVPVDPEEWAWAQCLGDYFSSEYPVEYVYVPGAYRGGSSEDDGQVAPPGHVVFTPGEERYCALMHSFNETRLEPFEEPTCPPGYAAAGYPGVWAFDQVPVKPDTFYCLLLQQRREQGPTTIVAVDSGGGMLIQTVEGETLKFDASANLYMWLAITRPPESVDWHGAPQRSPTSTPARGR